MTAAQNAANRRYADLLGWRPEDFGGTAFDDLLTTLITVRQQMLGTTADGIAGPNTTGAMLKDRLATKQVVFTTEADPVKKLEHGGEIAVLQGKILWLTNVLDLPPDGSADYTRCRDYIDRMIRTSAGLGWDFQAPYRHNFEWCGAFAAYCWAAARLSLKSRYSYFSSTYRLDRWARYEVYDAKAPNPRPAAGPYRMIIELDEKSTPVAAKFPDGTIPRAGDIVIVGMKDSDYGTHITVCESFDPVTGVVTTIEGNGTAAGPSGARQHGVVRGRRPIGIAAGLPPQTYHVRRILRPAPADIV